MKLFNAIFRRKQRLLGNRKRPGRSLAMSLAPLESRALLTVVGSTSLTLGSVAVASLVSVPQPTPPRLPLQSTSLLNFGPAPQAGGGDGTNWSHGDNSSDPETGQPYNRLRNHVALSEANVTVDGDTSPEFALADAGESKVIVRYGDEMVTLGSSQGVDHPQSIDLVYLTATGNSDASNPYPDLIVVNSGSDNILVFPGLGNDQFGPALNGNQGFAVGENPVSVSVADVNNDGIPDLLVANQGSDSVSILQGEQTTAGWGSNSVQTIAVGSQSSDTAPAKVLYKDFTGDGVGDLFVANSGSNNIYVYAGMGNGLFDTTDPSIFETGIGPEDMAFGQFDRRQQLDLVTVNSGSDDLTLIDGVLTANPTIQTISSGGVMPDAAIAFPGQNGMTDLMVANSGDGRLAFLQGSSSGLQLTGIITTSNLPAPTSLIPGPSQDNGIAFLAATAGEDAAQILSFDFAVGSAYMTTPISGSTATNQADGELIAGLMTYGDSSLEMIAVFWVGSPDQSGLSDEWSLRDPSSITALYTPTEGQGETSTAAAEVKGNAQDNQDDSAESNQDTPPPVVNYTSGTEKRLNAPQPSVEALAQFDKVFIDDEPLHQIVRLDHLSIETTSSTDEESQDGMIGDVIQSIRIRGDLFDGHPIPTEDDPSTLPPTRLDPIRGLENRDTSALEGQFETVPLISSVVLLSSRLILKVSPPRPPIFRRGRGFRITTAKPETGPPL